MVGSELARVQARCPCGQGLGLVWLALGVGESGKVVPQAGGTRVLDSGRGCDQVESFAIDGGRSVVASRVFVDNAEGLSANARSGSSSLDCVGRTATSTARDSTRSAWS